MARQFISMIRKFLSREDGPTAVEYAVMLSLIVVVCIAGIQAVGDNASGTFGMVSGSVASPVASASSGSSVPTNSGTWTASNSYTGASYSYDAGTGVLTNETTGATMQATPGSLPYAGDSAGPSAQSETWTKSSN